MPSPWLLKVLNDADTRRSRVKKRRMDEEEEERKLILMFTVIVKELYHTVPRSPSQFRKRWDDQYPVNLAVNEDSLVKEYRLDPKAFDILLELLLPSLTVNEEMAARAMARTRSEPIKASSRLGAALIILSGGRYIEAMRTHGLARSTTYQNLRKVVHGINACPQLQISYDGSLDGLKIRAKQYESKSSHGLLKFCTGRFITPILFPCN